MAKLHGKNLDIAGSPDGGSNWTDLSDVLNSVEFEDNTDSTEVTVFASDGNYREFLNGLNGLSFSAEGFWTAAAWTALQAMKASDNALIRIRLAGAGTTLPQTIMELKGISLSISAGNEDAITMSVSAQPSGAPDHTPQA